MNYVEHHFGDYFKKTKHLSVTAHGAYRLLMDLYYIEEEMLPVSVDRCCQLILARTPAERKAVKAVLAEFFDLTEKGWTHKRCDEEIARFRNKQAKAKRSANERWNFTHPHSERNANAMRTHSEGNAPNHQSPVTSNQTPVTSNQEKRKKHNASPTAPPDVDPQVWADFIQLRKGKRAAVTLTVIDGFRREAAKAHLSLEDALRMSCARGWMGFKAEWVEDRRKPLNGSSKQSALEERNRQATAEWLRRSEPPTEPEIFDAVASER